MNEQTHVVSRSPVVRVAADPENGDRTAVYEAAERAADTVTVVRTGPTGVAAYDPVVLATLDGRTAFHPTTDRELVADVVAALEDGELRPDDAAAVVAHSPETNTLPVPDDGPLAVGQRTVLGQCGWVNPIAPEDYDLLADEADTSAVDADLLGRGRGDASSDTSVTETWQTVRQTDGDPVVVLNANDTDERQQADRTLLTGAPVAVFDALALIADAVGAEDVIIYVDESDRRLHRHLGAAIDAAEDLLPVVPSLAGGPPEYRAGAPTAALEALEGNDRIEPRLQPPTPAEHGLYGRPTAIHTPRTVMQVREAVRSADADEASPDTRLFTVTGDVDAPATVELPSDSSLEFASDAVTTEGTVKMACVGGVLGGFTADLDVPPTERGLSTADLGTEGVIELLNEDRCAVATAGERAAFAAAENSGRCVPGREGTQQLAELLRDVYQGSFDGEKIRELSRVMNRTSNCRIGAHAPRPVTTAMDAFEPEFRAHTDGHCPSGTCTEKL